jgi:probable rRNA maturation factor
MSFLPSMELNVSWEENTVSSDEQEQLIALLRKGITEALHCGGGSDDSEIGLILVDDQTIHALNKSYRGVDRPTDVLSFAINEQGEGEPEIFMDQLLDEEVDASAEGVLEYEDSELGDIVISVEKAKVQAEEYGHSFQSFIWRFTAHCICWAMTMARKMTNVS